jgi:hypothetical protein
MSLTRLLSGQGRCTDAYDLLAPIYGWFSEGTASPISKRQKRCSMNWMCRRLFIWP